MELKPVIGQRYNPEDSEFGYYENKLYQYLNYSKALNIPINEEYRKELLADFAKEEAYQEQVYK